ncbi:hypothetical protein QBC35DRAFT_382402 [Podospora australis]|uniref:Uncharacterized protein n=1 Tax=Podospora australis TaxID=1536484 RepID=A0AAN7AIH7_9PEZI|nr:hypothetical protein QBC35DRAFT_382402 [Podospora australis]
MDPLSQLIEAHKFPCEFGDSWLTDDLYYKQIVDSLSTCDPRLRRRDPRATFIKKIPWPLQRTRVTVLESQAAGHSFQERTVYNDPDTFRASFQNTTPASGPDRRRIIIMEGQAPAYIGTVGIELGVHPSFFVDHERDSNPEAFQAAAAYYSTPLPSVVKEHVTMRYYELVYMPEHVRRFRVFCADTGRPISVTRVLGDFADTGRAHRKVSVWRRQREGGTGWDCVIVTDPPITSVCMSYENFIPIPLSSWPWQGGYPDFVPHQRQMRTREGPPRTSMLDDLVFYIEKHFDLFDSIGLDATLSLAQKIVASHYRQHVGFIQALISHVEHSMSRQENLDIFNTTTVEKQWSDVQSYERRLSYTCLDLESIMLQCHIPFAPPDTKASAANWQSSEVDFQSLYMAFKEVKQRVELLGSSITGLAGIAGNRQAVEEQILSRQEATNVKALAIVGLLFVPLAYVTGIFGMEGPYAPGDEKFWVYWAVALPSCAVAFITYFVWGGYLTRSCITTSNKSELRRQQSRSDCVC